MQALRKAWAQARSGDAQCVVLLAESGYGKTRLIHEFYRQISENENEGGEGYWPDVLSPDPTKIDVNPDFTGFESEGDIPWLWWGIRWGCPDDRNQKRSNICGLLDFKSRLERHVVGLINRRALKGAGREAAIKAAELAMDFVPLPNFVGMAKTGKEMVETISGFWKAREKVKAKQHDETKKAEDDVRNAIQLIRAYLDPEVKDAEDIPVILVLDDAQWADPMTLKFACDLFCRARAEHWPLLLLVTHWEREWHEAGEGKPLQPNSALDDWESFRDVEAAVTRRQDSQDALHIVSVGKLRAELVREAVTSAFPGLEDEDLIYIIERCGGNMLICEEFIKILETCDDWFEGEDITKGIVPEAKQVFREKTVSSQERAETRLDSIKKTDRSLYDFLRLGAAQGKTFYHELLAEVAIRLEKGDREWIREKATQAELPHCLVSNVSTPVSASEFRHFIYSEGLKRRMVGLWPTYRQALREVLDEWWEDSPDSITEHGFSHDLLVLYYNLIQESEDKPVLRMIEVAQRIAEKYQSGYLYRDALTWLEKAYESSESLLGFEHQATLRIMHQISNVYLKLGDYDLSAAANFECSQLMKRVLGDDHPDTLKARNTEALLLDATGNYMEAANLHRQNWEKRKNALGVEHVDSLSSMVNFANSLIKNEEGFDVGEYSELGFAEDLIRECLETQVRVFGKDHPDTLDTMNSLACIFEQRGGYEEAEGLHRELWERRKKHFTESSPEALESINNLAIVLLRREEFREATRFAQVSLAHHSSLFGQQHPNTLIAMNTYASCLYYSGDNEKAKELYRQCFNLRKSVFGLAHPDTQDALENLAGFYEHLKELDAAELLYREVLLGIDEAKGFSGLNPYPWNKKLAQLLQLKGDYESAIPLFRDCLEETLEWLDPGKDQSMLLNDFVDLAKCLELSGDFKEAEINFEKARNLSMHYYGEEHQFTQMCEESLSKIREDHSKNEET